MKTLLNACQAAALATVIATPAFAGAGSTDALDIDAAFGGDAPALASLDAQAMEDTRGRLPLLAIPLAVAGVDIGLAALFWGIYVPHYGGGGTCSNCSNTLQQH